MALCCFHLDPVGDEFPDRVIKELWVVPGRYVSGIRDVPNRRIGDFGYNVGACLLIIEDSCSP